MKSALAALAPMAGMALAPQPPVIRDVSHGARILMITDPAGFPLELVQTGVAH